MMYFTLFFLVLSSFLLGYGVGLVQKGIHVNINHKNAEIPTKYNESLVDELPQDVKQYYHQNNGYNNF